MARLGDEHQMPDLIYRIANIHEFHQAEEEWFAQFKDDHEAVKARLAPLLDEENQFPPKVLNTDLTGALLFFPRTDGKAIYRVEKTKPLTVSHVYCFDGWTVEDALIRGLNIADVVETLRTEILLDRVFNRSNDPNLG